MIDAVRDSIASLLRLYQEEPTRFFTENDLVCVFHRLVSDSLEARGIGVAHDADGLPHSLVHCEYPTPFRCDMKNSQFQVKSDEDRTPKGKKFKRGRYDIVVLNPSFIANYTYSQIKCQNYKEYTSQIATALTPNEPMIIYGVEFVFSRDAIKPSRGTDRDKTARAFVKTILQDAAKLDASLAVPGCMKAATLMAFTKDTQDQVLDVIRVGVQDTQTVTLASV